MIKLSAIGDIALFGEYDKIIEKQGNEFPFSLVSNHFKKRDIVIGNLEVPLSNLGSPDKSKPISLRGKPEAIKSLKNSGITHVSMANNHSYDYGEKAIMDTQKRLEGAGIPFAGIGDNIEDSRQPVVENISGVTLAILAYSSYTTNGRHYASNLRSGVAPLEYKYIKQDIAFIKGNDKDCKIITCFHWGEEMKNYPTPFQRDLARQVIKDGADLIIGHHPHVIQGIEKFEKGIIVYSLGNFCFPKVESPHIDGIGYDQLPKNRESFIFDCTISEDGIEGYDFTPIIINDNLQPEIALNEIELRIKTKIQYLSKPLNKAGYKKFFIDYSDKIKNNRFFSFLKNKGISGILKRLNPVYIRALIIALHNFLLERRHMMQFLKKEDI